VRADLLLSKLLIALEGIVREYIRDEDDLRMEKEREMKRLSRRDNARMLQKISID
jgi:hypothetical protein